jgi:dienelactone hydrolase
MVQHKSNRRQFLSNSTTIGLGVTGLGVANPTGAAERASTVSQPNANPTQNMKQTLLQCLGGDWPEPCELKPTVTKTQQMDGYRLEWLSYDVEVGDRVPAIALIPDAASKNSPAPAIVIWHQHNGQWHLGKSEPAGLAGNAMHHTGVALVKLGYVVLCPDALCFEERQDSQQTLKGGAFERFEFLRYVVAGKSMAWKNILDMRRAVDYLVSRPEVDVQRLGCYGHSMGSTHTWLVGPWEPRLKCLVGNCCLPTYAAIHRTKLLHCFPNFVPGWEQFGDTPEIAGMIAPRRLHLNFGETDRGSPIQEVRTGVKQIADIYVNCNAAEQFSYYIEPDTGHVLSDQMWQRTRDIFASVLS